jgi:hypothetical protein
MERLAFTQTDQRIEQASISWSGATHVTRSDDLHAARRGHRRRATPGSLDASIEEMRHIDRKSIAKDFASGVEQGGMENLIAPQQYTPVSGMGFEFFPMNPDTIPSTRVTRFERLVAARMGQGEQAT